VSGAEKNNSSSPLSQDLRWVWTYTLQPRRSVVPPPFRSGFVTSDGVWLRTGLSSSTYSADAFEEFHERNNHPASFGRAVPRLLTLTGHRESEFR
jgi:hypothetical protein